MPEAPIAADVGSGAGACPPVGKLDADNKVPVRRQHSAGRGRSQDAPARHAANVSLESRRWRVSRCAPLLYVYMFRSGSVEQIFA
jgi:hypothetical protein